MKYIIYFFISFILAFGLFLSNPKMTGSPGALSKGHQAISEDCKKCHAPFDTNFTQKCLECHPQPEIGLYKTTGEIIIPKKDKHAFTHQNFSKIACLSCHQEHDRKDDRGFLRDFSHSDLDKKAASDCIQCHKSPNDKLHSSIKARCVNCHKTDTWNAGKFMHSEDTQNCSQCHNAPTSNLHNELEPELRKNCKKCHGTKNWKNAIFNHTNAGTKCAKCHKIPGNKLHSDLNKTLKENCSDCHDTQNWKNAKFNHDNAGANCVACHRHPNDRIHEKSGDSCKTCHEVKSWKGAKFVHSSVQSDCRKCHQKNEPVDSLHKENKQDCSLCHESNDWFNTNWDHTRYFRLSGPHNRSCIKCHPGADYAPYSCYGCHAHSEGGVARRHDRMGMRNYGDCVECHRSSSEREAKQRWREIQNGR